MRIVHVLTRLLRAGAEENTLLTSAGQMARGHEVILLHGHEAVPDHARQVAPGIRLVEIPTLTREVRPSRDLDALRRMTRFFAVARPDIVHTHQTKAGILGRLAAARAGVPKVIHGVHILPFLGEAGVKRAIYLGAERVAARRTDAFIHVSDGMKAACLHHRVGSGRIHRVVRSGFDLQRFARAASPADAERLIGAAPDAPRPAIVTMLSALEPRKRQLELIERLPEFVRRVPNVRFLLGGEGHMRTPIARRLSDLGLERHVRLLGHRPDPERIVAMSDLCIHCASREGLPRSVLQYLAAGRPVLLFDLPGIGEVVTHGGNGVIVAQGDWPSFFAALEQLLSDHPFRARLARGAAQSDLDPWDVNRMASETLQIYDSVPPRHRASGLVDDRPVPVPWFRS